MRRVGMSVMGLCISAVLLFMSASIPLLAQQAGSDWSYEGKTGPFNWSKLDPSFHACNSGKEQSPIDIRGAHVNKSLAPIEFHYISGSMALLNTGHTVQVKPPAGSYIVVDGTRYDLVEFHFHHPGEEAVKGKLPDMSLQLVHKSADGKLAVIAVRLNEGNANAVMAALWAHLPKTAGATDKVTEPMNPGGLLPADRSYYTYTGSLTEPPCTEGVRWFVFKQQLEISRDQLRSFGSLYKVNSRQVQALHGRKVEASQ